MVGPKDVLDIFNLCAIYKMFGYCAPVCVVGSVFWLERIVSSVIQDHNAIFLVNTVLNDAHTLKNPKHVILYMKDIPYKKAIVASSSIQVYS